MRKQNTERDIGYRPKDRLVSSDVSEGMCKSKLEELSSGRARGRALVGSGGIATAWVGDGRSSVRPSTKEGVSK